MTYLGPLAVKLFFFVFWRNLGCKTWFTLFQLITPTSWAYYMLNLSQSIYNCAYEQIAEN